MKSKLNYSKVLLFALFYLIQVKVHAWEVDLTRRQVDFQRVQNERMPATEVTVNPEIQPELQTQKNTPTENKNNIDIIDAIKNAATSVDTSKEIVIVQTENGFVPSTLNLQKGQVYQIHVINLNHKDKNVSFLMDSFSQSHNTVFGTMKSFKINPNIEGVFSFQSPETGAAGTVIVSPDKARKVASDSSEKK